MRYDREAAMSDDMQTLAQINHQIGAAESRGNRAWLAQVLAPKLAFRRADGETFDGRAEFLDKVAPGAARDTLIESIQLEADCAIVRCVVTISSDQGVRSYRNLRLFVRHDAAWKLLGWANTPL